MNDHHALITQLCAELDHNRRMLLDDRRVTHPLADRARAALAHQPDFRALCAELLLFSEQAGEICTCEGLWPKCDPNYTLLNRARAALAADGPAVPEGREPAAIMGEPSDDGLLEIARTVALIEEDGSTGYLDFADVSHLVLDFARAVLARWGHQPAPPAEGEVGEVVRWLLEEAVRAANSDASRSAGMLTWAAQVLGEHADLLERQATPQPVPVSERLPGDQLCWWYEPDEDDDGSGYGGRWTLLRIRGGTGTYTHWLSCPSLPLPDQK